MKFNKQVVTILILISLLLSAISMSYYFYTQNQKSLKKNNQLRVVYIAAKNIKKNAKITKKDVKEYSVAKKFILSKPLIKKENNRKICY